MAGGVEYQVTKVDPTDPETKGMVHQVHKVSEEIAATIGGKVYRARIINDPTAPTVAGKVYQIVLIDDPDDPSVKGMVYNAILTGGSEAVVVGPAVSPLALDDAIADTMEYVKAYGGIEQRNLPIGYTLLDYIETDGNSYIDTNLLLSNTSEFEITFQSADATLNTPVMGSISGGTSFTSTNNLCVTYTVASGLNAYSVYCDGAAGDANHSWNGGDAQDKLKHTVKYNGLNIAPTIDGVDMEQLVPTTLTTNTPTVTTWLFGRNNTGSGTKTQTGVRIYDFKVDGVAHFVPCKNTSNVVGMYDLVSGQFFTNAGTGDFVAGPTVVPTPATPIDIISNNGVLKYSVNMANVNAQTALIGYYISSSGVVTADANNWVYQDYIPVKPNTTYTLSFDVNVYYVTISEYSTADDSGFIVRNAGASGVNASLTITTGATTNYVRFGTNIDRAQVTLEEVLGIHWMLGPGSIIAPYQPYVEGGLYTDGTVETIGIYGGNLVDLDAVTDGYYYDPQGNYTALSAARLTDYIPVEAGKNVKVYFKSLSTTSTLNVRINIFNSNKVWQSQEVLSLEPLADGTKTITPTDNGYIRVSGNYSGGAIVDWNTASITESLCSATTEMLLSVGTSTDEQEILSGAITRNVGVKVLDGTEGWQLATATDLVQFYTPSTQGVIANSVSLTSTIAPYGCTAATRTQYDFGCYSGGSGNLCFQMKGSATLTTTTAWTQYLADQYAAGTPVIVVYPLATPTTESVAGQTLQVQDGDNTLEITQASIDDLQLEAEYEKEAD